MKRPEEQNHIAGGGAAVGASRRPALEVLPVASGAVVDVRLPGVRKQEIAYRLDHNHLIVHAEVAPGQGAPYHLDLELVSGTDDSQVRAVVSDEKLSVLVPTPDHSPGCMFRSAA